MKIKFVIFIYLFSFSLFGQKNSLYYQYLNPERGHQVQIVVNYGLRFVQGEIELSATFETRPSSGARPYFYKGRKFDLVKHGIYIDYSKISSVNVTLNATIGGSSRDIEMGLLDRRIATTRLLCGKFGWDRDECSKYKNRLSEVFITIVSVSLNTTDNDIERKLDKIIANGGDNGNDGGYGNDGGNGNESGNENSYSNANNNGNGTNQKTKKNKPKRRPFDEIPESEYTKPMSGKSRKLKPESNNNKKLVGKSPTTIKTNLNAPEVKIITNSSKTKGYPVSKSDFINDGAKKTNNSKYSTNSQSTNPDFDKAEQYYKSAFKNANEGKYTQGIKDLKLQKAYTSDPGEIDKINHNISVLEGKQDYKNQWTQVNQRIQRENYLNQQSLDFTNKVDAAANGNDLYAAAQKGGYAIGSALGGRFDVNSAAGAAISLLNHLGKKKREKEAFEAKKREIKAKIAEENRIRELERQKFVDGLKRERITVTKKLPKYSYPNYLTDNDIKSYYYFIIYTGQDILNTDYPEADITDIVEVRKYKDGTWPFENDFKNNLQKLSSKPIKHIIGYTDYKSAAEKLASIIKGFGKGGVKLSFVKASKENTNETDDISSLNKESNKDFWGKSVKTIKNKSTKKVIKKGSVSKKEDFWGKTIKIKD